MQRPSASHHSPTTNRAFTLLEMSVVMVIISLVLAGGLATFVQYTEKKGYVLTQQRLEELQVALGDYAQAYGRLPCPGDITDAIDDANFGLETGDMGVCETANFQYTTDNDVVAGLLPIRALGLSDDYVFDSWGSRLLYAVDRRFTANAGLTVYGSGTIGKVSVSLQSSGGSVAAAYVLLSHGANRHGAYPRAGGTLRTTGRLPSATESSDPYWAQEMENCDCDDGTAASATFDDTFVQSSFKQDTTDANDLFDDILVYSTREQLGE